MEIKLKKGLDLKIAGAVTDMTVHEADAKVYAITPDAQSRHKGRRHSHGRRTTDAR